MGMDVFMHRMICLDGLIMMVAVHVFLPIDNLEKDIEPTRLYNPLSLQV